MDRGDVPARSMPELCPATGLSREWRMESGTLFEVGRELAAPPDRSPLAVDSPLKRILPARLFQNLELVL